MPWRHLADLRRPGGQTPAPRHTGPAPPRLLATPSPGRPVRHRGEYAGPPANLLGRDGDDLLAIDWEQFSLGPAGFDLGYFLLAVDVPRDEPHPGDHVRRMLDLFTVVAEAADQL